MIASSLPLSAMRKLSAVSFQPSAKAKFLSVIFDYQITNYQITRFLSPIIVDCSLFADDFVKARALLDYDLPEHGFLPQHNCLQAHHFEQSQECAYQGIPSLQSAQQVL